MFSGSCRQFESAAVGAQLNLPPPRPRGILLRALLVTYVQALARSHVAAWPPRQAGRTLQGGVWVAGLFDQVGWLFEVRIVHKGGDGHSTRLQVCAWRRLDQAAGGSASPYCPYWPLLALGV